MIGRCSATKARLCDISPGREKVINARFLEGLTLLAHNVCNHKLNVGVSQRKQEPH